MEKSYVFRFYAETCFLLKEMVVGLAAPAPTFFSTVLSYHLWRRGVVVITTTQLHLTKLELRLCTGSNPARGVIRDGEGLWQWSRLGIRLNAFLRSTIPQKQFIIITIYLLRVYNRDSTITCEICKVDYNDIRTRSMTSFWCLTLNIFLIFF